MAERTGSGSSGLGPKAVGPRLCVVVPAALAAALLLGLVAVPGAHAHDPDTSYTRIEISDDRIATRLTFDLEVLGRIALIDVDEDGDITRPELESAAAEIQRYLDRRIALSVEDGEPGLGPPGGIEWPDDAEERIAFEDRADTLVGFRFERPLDGPPELITLIVDVWSELGFRHANLAEIGEAWGEPLPIVFTAYEPDYDYFVSEPPSIVAYLKQYVVLGAEHILIGYDHLLFLLALVVVGRLRQIVKIVTAFTLAHSITLAVAALGVLVPPSWLVEAAIAATIVYVAAGNLRRDASAERWRLAFCFGLVHGFGFANVLAELGLSAHRMALSLLGFNVGVEIGQLAIVLVLVPAAAWLARRPFGFAVQATLSLAIGLAGSLWFLERAFGLTLMPI